MDNTKNKIAYAASIAQKNVSKIFKEKLKRNLTKEKIKYISLRENTGKVLVENITGRNDIECTLDPTLMLSSDEWSEIAVKPSFIDENEKYILCYFLGNVSSKLKKLITDYAELNNCRVLNLLDKNKEEYYCIDFAHRIILNINSNRLDVSKLRHKTESMNKQDMIQITPRLYVQPKKIINKKGGASDINREWEVENGSYGDVDDERKMKR